MIDQHHQQTTICCRHQLCHCLIISPSKLLLRSVAISSETHQEDKSGSPKLRMDLTSRQHQVHGLLLRLLPQRQTLCHQHLFTFRYLPRSRLLKYDRHFWLFFPPHPLMINGHRSRPRWLFKFSVPQQHPLLAYLNSNHTLLSIFQISGHVTTKKQRSVSCLRCTQCSNSWSKHTHL